ncbi:hypothetical protein FC72_GL001938 [Companilactobacillus tucceti DSM 20183]|uniref:Uncharacterized protein n=1 Tax=Companilactobacillus tucceti DSM 20183 TaxID=1423811 RepID=A0A0R1J9N6_9LACO|nr:hypothetical protein [Companilactobacillus tucceti]KRK64698.1 hypothetical protein FC72_GL001938 [Companilactobacillus tucceti DSM 20183]
MSFFKRNKKDNDPIKNDFSKISQEIKKSPEKLSEAQKLFKDNESLRKVAAKEKLKQEE